MSALFSAARLAPSAFKMHSAKSIQWTASPLLLSRGHRTTSAITTTHWAMAAPFANAMISTSPAHQAKAPRPGPDQGFKVNFILQDGEEITVQANKGESLLDVAWANDIDIEGACDASLACSTCHLILDQSSYDKLEPATDEEEDMLDLAFGLTDTSRLGCQVLMEKELDGIIARIPSATRNAQA